MRPVKLDPWTFTDHKQTDAQPLQSLGAWVPAEDARRLDAYQVYGSYMRNAARSLIEDDQVDERREYGEPAAFVAEIVSALLGEEPSIEADERVREWLADWADTEGLISKLLIADNLAVSLGDAVIQVGWDTAKKRPFANVIDPGFYFPTLTESGGWPTEVRLAWEFLDNDGAVWVRVRRWWLDTVVDENGKPVERSYPWGKSSQACYYSGAAYPLDRLRKGRTGWDQLDPTRADYELIEIGGELVIAEAVDLGIDFLPVVHLPNTLVADDEHFGTSSLGRVLQALDELQAGDTDLAQAAALVAYPPLATETGIAAVGVDIQSYGPGTVYEGKISQLDTSRSLDALLKFVADVRDRVAVNGGVPQFSLEQAIGGGSEVSGFALKLRRQSFKAMIDQMRLARAPKWRLVLKFAIRYAMLSRDVNPAEEALAAEIVPSPVLPTDAASTVEQLASLFAAGLLSLETAVERISETLGLQIDTAEEIARIRAVDFKGANALIDAAGAIEPGLRYLGRDPNGDPTQP